MDIAWEDMRVFLAVAETGSMSAAARRLRVGQPTVSRRLAELEDELGYPLFRRAATGVALTGEAERLVEPARKMAEWAGEVSRAAASKERALKGLVRIAAPPGVAWDFLAPFAAFLKQREPGVRLEILSGHSYLDLARGEADLALRIRAPTQEDLVCVASVELKGAVYATKAYAKRLPKKYTLAELDWICWAPPYDHFPPNPQLEAMIPNFVPVFSSDSMIVMWRAAEAGIGVITLGGNRHRFAFPTPLVPLEVDLGELAKSSIHLVCARSALETPRVRWVADRLVDELQLLKKRS